MLGDKCIVYYWAIVTLFEVTGSYSSSYGSYSYPTVVIHHPMIYDNVWSLIYVLEAPAKYSYFDCFHFSCIYNTSTLPGFNPPMHNTIIQNMQSMTTAIAIWLLKASSSVMCVATSL